MNSKSIIFHSRMVGLTYLLTTIIGLTNTFLIKPKAYDFGSLLNNELWFRAAQIGDLCMFSLVLWMTIAMYLSIKHVSSTLAKFVFSFRFAEIIVGFVIVLLSFMSLVALKQNSSIAAFSEPQMQVIYEMSLKLADIGWAISFCLLAVGALIYFYLLHQSKGIPRWLSYWGFFTYVSLFTGFLLQLIISKPPVIAMLIMAPGAVFEFTFGCWMLTNGLRLNTNQSLIP